MTRRIAYVEEIDWKENTCKVRVPNLDGLGVEAYGVEELRMILSSRPPVEALEEADIPYHLQGLRVHDIVYVLDSEDDNDHLTILAFFGGVYKEA